MARRAFKYDKETGEMYEVVPTPRIPHGQIDDNFFSPVDGSVITSQRKLHEHNIRNGVTQVNPEIEHGWKTAAEKRERFFNGNPDGKKERISAIKESIAQIEAGKPATKRRMDDAL